MARSAERTWPERVLGALSGLLSNGGVRLSFSSGAQGKRMATNDGGPAFPRPFSNDGFNEEPHSAHRGMSLRDWFAGQALVGLAAAGNQVVINGKAVSHEVAAYIVADAMLVERELEGLVGRHPRRQAE